ncbi:MAG: transferase, partial [Planctomycetes bacterium]|nr:transferase [Planctomycetota bacterium]
NCKIGSGSIITACAEISGSVQMGKNSWVGPNASLMNGIEIAEGSTIGLGAVLTRSFTEPNKIIFGNPAMTKEEHKMRKEGK